MILGIDSDVSDLIRMTLGVIWLVQNLCQSNLQSNPLSNLQANLQLNLQSNPQLNLQSNPQSNNGREKLIGSNVFSFLEK